MAVDKKVNYDVQGGVKNYLGKQQQVKAPLKWKSSPDSPETELAYITEAEKDLLVKQDLHGSLQGGVNRGPSGIMSLDGYGSFDDPSDPGRDTGMSGAATSAAESGGGSGADARELASESQRVTGGPSLPPGVVNQNAQDYRNAFINAGGGQRVNPGFFDSRNTVSPQELAFAKIARNNPNNRFGLSAYRKTRGGGLGSFISGGGLLGGIIRNVGRSLGFGKNYNQPTYNMSGYNSLGLGGTGQEGFGIPNFESGDGDYDMLGNKINEITGEIISPTGESLGFIPGYPGSNTGGITNIISNAGDGNNYVPMLRPEDSTMPEDEELLGGFKSRFLQNRTQEEREAIEKMINEKFNYDYSNFGLEDMDGS